MTHIVKREIAKNTNAEMVNSTLRRMSGRFRRRGSNVEAMPARLPAPKYAPKTNASKTFASRKSITTWRKMSLKADDAGADGSLSWGLYLSHAKKKLAALAAEADNGRPSEEDGFRCRRNAARASGARGAAFVVSSRRRLPGLRSSHERACTGVVVSARAAAWAASLPALAATDHQAAVRGTRVRGIKPPSDRRWASLPNVIEQDQIAKYVATHQYMDRETTKYAGAPHGAVLAIRSPRHRRAEARSAIRAACVGSRAGSRFGPGMKLSPPRSQSVSSGG